MDDKLQFFPVEREYTLAELPNIIGRHYRLSDLRDIYISQSNALAPLGDYCINQQNIKLFAIGLELTPYVRDYLPGIYFVNEEKGWRLLKEIVAKTMKGYQFAYMIHNYLHWVGMVIFNTPSYNKLTIGIEKWTLDFFVVKYKEESSLMYDSLARVLYFMKNSLHVGEVYVLVHEDDTKCFDLIKQFGAYRVARAKLPDGKDQLFMRININNIDFQGF